MKKSADISQALNAAALARLTLAGKRVGEGFWAMPHGAHFVRECWRQNMARAKRLNRDSDGTATAAANGDLPVPASAGRKASPKPGQGAEQQQCRSGR